MIWSFTISRKILTKRYNVGSELVLNARFNEPTTFGGVRRGGAGGNFRLLSKKGKGNFWLFLNKSKNFNKWSLMLSEASGRSYELFKRSQNFDFIFKMDI